MTVELSITVKGGGQPLLLLPPAPYGGAFFETFLAHLPGVEGHMVDYPGYGQSPPILQPSIKAYAEAIAGHCREGISVIGFHTGCLVAVELAKRVDVGAMVLIDVPAFGPQKRHALTEKFSLKKSESNLDAFLAAFAYDAEVEFPSLLRPVSVIATQSSLLEDTQKAASLLPGAQLHQRLDVTEPALGDAKLSKLVLTCIKQDGGWEPNVRA